MGIDVEGVAEGGRGEGDAEARAVAVDGLGDRRSGSLLLLMVLGRLRISCKTFEEEINK